MPSGLLAGAERGGHCSLPGSLGLSRWQPGGQETGETEALSDSWYRLVL